MKNLFGEFLATFCLVFVSVGLAALERSHTLILNNWFSSLVVGITVSIIIYVMRSNFWVHFNPTVSIAKWYDKSINLYQLIGAVLSQCVGATVATLAVLQITPDYPNLGVTELHISTPLGFTIEVIATCVLVFSILYQGNNSKSWNRFQPAVIGTVVFLAIGFFGQHTGASMNPARSFGPALVSRNWNGAWLYWIAPILGAVVGIYITKLITGRNKSFEVTTSTNSQF